jgi:hypothetical protein
MKEINWNTYNWGPFLWRSEIDIDICDEMLIRFNSCTTDHREGLASLIDTVHSVEDQSNRGWFVEKITPYLECYVMAYKDWCNNELLWSNELFLNKLWINYQQKFEFNPEHTHSGDLSFVIYLQIPESVLQENITYKGRSAGPGGITFDYGEKNLKWAITNRQFFPKKGDIFIFPAGLRHWVYPFKSEGTRISVSGNLDFVYE